MKKHVLPGLVISPKYATVAELGLERLNQDALGSDRYVLDKGFQSFRKSIRCESPRGILLSSRPFSGRKMRSPKVGMKLANEIIKKFVS